MKLGDMIETNTGHVGLIVDMEMLYPGHPCSPVRNYIVSWLDDAPRYHVIHGDADLSKVSAFSVKRKISESR